MLFVPLYEKFTVYEYCLLLQALLYDAILECRVESYPPAAISWVFDSDVLVNNQHYELVFLFLFLYVKVLCFQIFSPYF